MAQAVMIIQVCSPSAHTDTFISFALFALYLLYFGDDGKRVQLRAHAFAVGRLNFMEHKLVLVVHEVLRGALDVAEELEGKG